jgi:hypothetical protein
LEDLVDLLEGSLAGFNLEGAMDNCMNWSLTFGAWAVF